jgi:glycerol uptake facilitator-like aquaporin
MGSVKATVHGTSDGPHAPNHSPLEPIQGLPLDSLPDQDGRDILIPLSETNVTASTNAGTLVDGPPLSPSVLVGEFVATFLFVALSVASTNSGMSTAGIAAANGAIIAAVAAAFMPVSGAHLNPAVTAALAVTNRVPLLRAAAFVPIQLAAAVLATYLVGSSGVDIVANFAAFHTSADAAGTVRALWSECVPMFFIVVIVFQTAVATRAEGGVGTQLSALYIGLAVFACACIFSGAFNPARAFGPALYLSAWSAHWIFWTPVPVAMIAALVCEHLFIAPTAGRPANSWLATFLKRLAVLSRRIKSFGVAGLIAYGFTNILYYLPVLIFAWIRVSRVDSSSVVLSELVSF